MNVETMPVPPRRKKGTLIWQSWESMAKNFKIVKKPKIEICKRYSLGNSESIYGVNLRRNSEFLERNQSATTENSDLKDNLDNGQGNFVRKFENLETGGVNSGILNASNGAIPKTVLNEESVLEENNLVQENENLGVTLENGHIENDSDKKLHESETMTAQVTSNAPFIHFNSQISKDVPDNGTAATALLTKNLQKIQTGLLLRTETERLKTFKNWPNKRIEPKKLAAAGFYYLGKADIVECFECGIKGHNWEENDKPMDDHMRWNRNCPFVRQNDTTTEHDNAQAPPRRSGRDICGNTGVVEILPNSETEDNNVVETETSLKNYVIQTKNGPSHLDQITYETRLATFENWPKSMKQKPAELAAAGFYYLGVGDQTLCFHCGGGLKDWVEEDDPWEQHALWFPKCVFLLLKKGAAFIEAVQGKHKDQKCCKTEIPETGAACSANTKELQVDKEENNKEKKSEDSPTICKICFKNEMGVLFLPCGHIVACIDCASALKECAVCRKNIQAAVRAFLQ